MSHSQCHTALFRSTLARKHRFSGCGRGRVTGTRTCCPPFGFPLGGRRGRSLSLRLTFSESPSGYEQFACAFLPMAPSLFFGFVHAPLFLDSSRFLGRKRCASLSRDMRAFTYFFSKYRENFFCTASL